MKYFEETTNWNAHYTTDWSAESATNGVVNGGVLMNMLPKDHIHVVQSHSINMSYVIQSMIYVFDTHIYVDEHIFRVSHICC